VIARAAFSCPLGAARATCCHAMLLPAAGFDLSCMPRERARNRAHRGPFRVGHRTRASRANARRWSPMTKPTRAKAIAARMGDKKSPTPSIRIVGEPTSLRASASAWLVITVVYMSSPMTPARSNVDHSTSIAADSFGQSATTNKLNVHPGVMHRAARCAFDGLLSRARRGQRAGRRWQPPRERHRRWCRRGRR
jgi:hypothetical protein